MKRMLLAFGCSLVLPLSASAATYYVSPKGNDGNSCSQAKASNKPRKTIQAGLKCAGPGDTVLVSGGTYVESVSVGSSGKKGSPITLKAKPGEKVTWRSKNTDPNSKNGALTIIQKNFLRIEGFTFDATVTRTTIHVGNNPAKKGTNPVQGIEIINNTFTNNGRNSNESRIIYFQSVGHKTFGSGDAQNVISGNTFTGNYGWSITLNAASDTVVRANTCTDQKGSRRRSDGTYLARFIQIGGDDSAGNNSVRNLVERNTIRDFVVQPYAGSSPYVINAVKLDANADHNTIRNNQVYNLDAAQRKTALGIQTESRCDDNVITGNIVSTVGQACYQDGTTPTTTTQRNQWVNNVGYGCECGLVLSNAQGATVKNNIFSHNGKAQVHVNSQTVANGGHLFSNNLYYDPSGGTLNTWKGSKSCSGAAHTFSSWVSASKEKNAINKDPEFMNPPSDFRLKSTSPAIDAGVARVDLGAYPTVETRSATTAAATAPSPLSIPTGLRIVE